LHEKRSKGLGEKIKDKITGIFKSDNETEAAK
jgi:hypothetical protein